MPFTHSQIVKNVSSGFGHSCAIWHGGILKCWGNNKYDQISSMPQLLSRKTIKVTSGSFHSCAVRNFKSDKIKNNLQYGLICWGRNDMNMCEVPEYLMNKMYSQISAGSEHTCALSRDG